MRLQPCFRQLRGCNSAKVKINENSFKQANERKISQGYIFVCASLQPHKDGNHVDVSEKKKKNKK